MKQKLFLCLLTISMITARTLMAVDEDASTAPALEPNDPYFNSQNALRAAPTTNSSVSKAWAISTNASNVIVAVIDTGADLKHPDIKDNLWINSYEIPDNGIDDDGDGYVDDVNGYDFHHQDGNPDDEWGHGTLVAGIIGAVGNNHIGSSGVAWSVQLMILKVFGNEAGADIQDMQQRFDMQFIMAQK